VCVCVCVCVRVHVRLFVCACAFMFVGVGVGWCMASITLIPNNFLIPHHGKCAWCEVNKFSFA